MTVSKREKVWRNQWDVYTLITTLATMLSLLKIPEIWFGSPAIPDGLHCNERFEERQSKSNLIFTHQSLADEWTSSYLSFVFLKIFQVASWHLCSTFRPKTDKPEILLEQKGNMLYRLIQTATSFWWKFNFTKP